MARDTRTSCSQSMSVPGVMEELAEHITLGDVPVSSDGRVPDGRGILVQN